ncbi:MAG TPA: hypothetical protein VLZ89_01745 [Anaerolineales bacterium]|nr:hypothetical protein [Anaerolineales bacterium]
MTTSPPRLDHGEAVAAKYGIARSPEWPKVQKQHLKLQPRCAACKGGSHGHANLQVHHIFPFHYCIALGRPDLELDQRNLITLCEDEAGYPADDHHLLIGHLDDFESSNLDVVLDARTTFHGMNAANIKKDPRWIKKRAARLKPLDKMTAGDKADFQAQMNARFPRK